jgi:PHP family Zn ribbon phosphoesterase
MKLTGVCPVCRRKLTKGVEQRVEELADRPKGFTPKDAIGFVRLLPLSEIISAVLGVDSPSAQPVWNIYNLLVGRFGDEYTVLIDASKEALRNVADEKIADAIVRVRQGRVKVVPGYDGVYGRPIISENTQVANNVMRTVQQRNLSDFM